MRQPFLTDSEIRDLQTQEIASHKPQKRTPEQIAAIYSSGTNILVSASAGSGKTFVMVERILDKISRGIPVEALFIATFTTKAADEFKERLDKRLRESIQESRHQDEKVWYSQQLENLGQADIGTMDAFAQRLVKQEGYRLGLPSVFRILSEPFEQEKLKDTVFDALFEDYMTGDQKALFTQLVTNFSGKARPKDFAKVVYAIHRYSQSTADPKKWLEQTLLSDMGRMTSYADLPDALVESFLDEVADAADQVEASLEAQGDKVFKKDGTLTKKAQTSRNFITEMRQLTADFSGLYGKLRLKEVAQIVSTAIQAAKKKEPLKDLLKTCETISQYEMVFAYQGDAEPMLKLLQEVVIDFSDRYLAIKLQEARLEFSDIMHLAVRLLEDFPDLAKSYQERYHEVMVDEYQDNNHGQERLLNLLSNGHNRFMVGDIKQSIYRFRQADPLIFKATFERFQKHPEEGKLILLKENFRSDKEVIDISNAIFSHLMTEDLGDIQYDATHTLVQGNGAPANADHIPQFLYYDEGSGEAQLDFPDYHMLAQAILKEHAKGVAFSDMAILQGKRTRRPDLVTVLAHYGIPYEADDDSKGHYLEAVEVLVMLETLRTIDNPLQDYPLVALLKSPMFDWDEDDLLRIALQGEGPFYRKIQLSEKAAGAHPDLIEIRLTQKVTDFLQTLADWRDYARWHSLYELIWHIYQDRFYYDYVALMPDPDQRQANLEALAIRAKGYEDMGYKGLSRFISLIDRVLETDHDLADVVIKRPANAVSLMTIHQSKGKEFGYVFVIDCDQKHDSQDQKNSYNISRAKGLGIRYLANMAKEVEDRSITYLPVVLKTMTYQLNQAIATHENLSERMRILYVAMTRAKHKLYLVGKGKAEKLSDYATHPTNGHLPLAIRQKKTTFQDWLLGVYETFGPAKVPMAVVVVTQEEILASEKAHLTEPVTHKIPVPEVRHVRQTATITEALERLEAVDAINERFKAAIQLPSLRTPSQIKRLYKPVLDDEVALDVMVEGQDTLLDVSLPSFGEKETVSPAEIGAAMHELMQRLPLDKPVTDTVIQETLEAMPQSEVLKSQLSLDKVLSFWQSTELGRLMQDRHDVLHRESPFAMLMTDRSSQESFVVRGIVDAYLALEDKVLLIDYKTDRYDDVDTMIDRYTTQMTLYAEALGKAYQKPVSAYLVLLGGKDRPIAIVSLDEG